MGRPTMRTTEIDAVILDGLRAGTPLTELCRGEGMPSDESWRNWCKQDPDLADSYTSARDAGFDAIAAQVIPIIDNVTEEAASRRVRAEYRLKLLAKWDPKRYGERLLLVEQKADLKSMSDAELEDELAKLRKRNP